MSAQVMAFEDHRRHLTGVAYRMLGSLPEAEDAVQETWLRYDRADTGDVRSLRAWLTTVCARVCLNMLRARERRGEQPLEHHVPDPVVVDPAAQAEVADAVGMALLVVLQTLSPAERLAFVLHDMFAVPFEEIARMVDKSPAATRQLASRARRRVRETAPPADADLASQRAAVDAFQAAAQDGDLDRLVATLHPDVVLRADTGAVGSRTIRGAEAVAAQALHFRRVHAVGWDQRDVLVNGGPGTLTLRDGVPISVVAYTVVDGLVGAMDILADPERLARLELV